MKGVPFIQKEDEDENYKDMKEESLVGGDRIGSDKCIEAQESPCRQWSDDRRQK